MRLCPFILLNMLYCHNFYTFAIRGSIFFAIKSTIKLIMTTKNAQYDQYTGGGGRSSRAAGYAVFTGASGLRRQYEPYIKG